MTAECTRPLFPASAATGTRSPPFRLDGHHPWAFRAGGSGDSPQHPVFGVRGVTTDGIHNTVWTTPSVLHSTGITRLLRYYDLC